MPPPPASIKARALQWLAQREHSHDEMRGKLLRLLRRRPAYSRNADRPAVDSAQPTSQALGLPCADAATDPSADFTADPKADSAADPTASPTANHTAEVDALLLWLEANGHLSQARFIESRVHARQSRFGNLRIRQELKQHGVTLDADTQQALQRSEFDRAQDLWRKKYGGLAGDAAARLRQMRFLAGRGFSIDVVRRVVKAGAAHDLEADTLIHCDAEMDADSSAG